MKKVIVYIAFILSILALIKSPNAKATASSLEFVLLSTEEALLFLDNIRLEVFDDEPEKYIIGGFDVNDDGSYALIAEYDNLICVYNANGDFLYGYHFQNTGDYEIIWEEGNVSIYFVRASILATFDRNGSCIEIKEFNPLGSNRNQIDKIFRRKSIRVGDINYFLERDFLGSGYGRLSAVSADGTRTVLYDVSAQHLIQGIITIVFLVLVFGIGGIIVVRSHMRKHQLRGE